MKEKLKSLGWVGLYILIMFAASFVFSILLVVAVFAVGIRNGLMGNQAFMSEMTREIAEGIQKGAFLLIVNAVLGLVLLAVFGLWYYFREKKYHFRPDYYQVFSIKNILSIVGTAVLMQYAIRLLITIMYMIAPGLEESYHKQEEMFYVGNSSPWIIFISICLLGPVMEEMLFRGMIYGKLRRTFSMVPAMLISALIFGVSHMNWVQGVYAGGCGLILAYVYEKTQTIWASCLLHSVVNSSNYLLEMLEEFLESVGIPILNSFCQLLLGIASIVFIGILLRRFRGRPIPGQSI